MSDSLSLNPDKNNISWIAYYNISGFVNSDNYNPQNLNNPVYAKGLNIYDNGVSFTYSHPNVKRDFTVRAGNKEWITAHMNKKETYTQDSKTDISKFNSVNSYPELDYSDLKGDYDIMP